MDWEDFHMAAACSPYFHYRMGMGLPVLFPMYGNLFSRGDPYAAIILPPWAGGRFWRPRGGFYGYDPMRELARDTYRRGLPKAMFGRN